MIAQQSLDFGPTPGAQIEADTARLIGFPRRRPRLRYQVERRQRQLARLDPLARLELANRELLEQRCPY